MRVIPKASRPASTAGARCCAGHIVDAHPDDGDRVDQDDEGREQHGHHDRARPLATAHLLRDRIGQAHAITQASITKAPKIANGLRIEKANRLFSGFIAGRLGRACSSIPRGEGQEGEGEAPKRRRRRAAGEAQRPGRDRRGRHRHGIEQDPERSPSPRRRRAASARRRPHNRSGRIATAPRNAAASRGRSGRRAGRAAWRFRRSPRPSRSAAGRRRPRRR